MDIKTPFSLFNMIGLTVSLVLGNNMNFNFHLEKNRCIIEPFQAQNDKDPITNQPGIRVYNRLLGTLLNWMGYATKIHDPKGSSVFINTNSAVKWINRHNAAIHNPVIVSAKDIKNEKVFITLVNNVIQATSDILKTSPKETSGQITNTQPSKVQDITPVGTEDLTATQHSATAKMSKVREVTQVQAGNSSPTSVACKFGDTAGYLDGSIEFNHSTKNIHFDWWQGDPPTLLTELATNEHFFSDDTVFSDMTKTVLEKIDPIQTPTKDVVNALAASYVKYQDDPYWNKRGHGIGMKSSLEPLKGNSSAWNLNNFLPSSAGCGAAMRTMPIGEKCFGAANREKLIQISLASSYITHTSPSGFLGGVASALFTALAFENVPFSEWPKHLLDATQKNGPAWQYAETIVNKNGQDNLYELSWNDFNDVWNHYQATRFTPDSTLILSEFPDTPEGRDKINIQSAFIAGEKYPGQPGAKDRSKKQISTACWPGASGLNAPLIAYDALMLTMNKFLKDNNLTDRYPLNTLTPHQFKDLLQKAGPEAQQQVFKDLIERACLHGGDSDSTGAIAFYWEAACVGDLAVPEQYTTHLEPSVF